MSDNKKKDIKRTQTVKDWIKNLTDQQAKGAIVDRIERMKLGLYGKVDSIKSEPGLWEMIVDIGPGYRVYYAEFGSQVVVLILGGPKSTQKADIKKAGKILADMRVRHLAAKQKREEEEKEAAKAANKNSSSKTKLKGK